jgi:hypothetical protein
VISAVHTQSQTDAASREQSLKEFLENTLGISRSAVERSVKYLSAFVDLDGDGVEEAIIYVTDQDWCGSGGCTTLVLKPEGSSFRVVTKIAITNPPIRVFPSKTNGWLDIGVWVQGGGIQPGYVAELSFDGETYPVNPTVPPAKRLNKKREMKGQPIIALRE